MTRLFISLYLAISCGIFFIGWTTEKVWQYVQTPSDDDISQLVLLAKTVPLLIEHQSLTKDEISQIIQTPIVVFAEDEIALSQAQAKLMAKGEHFLSYNEKNQLLIFLPLLNNNSLVQVGPITLVQETSNLKWVLLSLSYLFLAGIIALWTWPLWRDLRYLQSATVQFAKGNFDGNIPITQRSVIAPLSNAFKAMAVQISRLIDEQKQLTNAVSHDLRTPLSRLKFSIAMLECDAEQKLEMKQDVEELESLVDEILNYGRLESHHNQLSLSKVNLVELLHNQVEKMQRGATKKITLQLDKNTSIMCLCDGHLIERATQNLITNAIRYGNNIVNISIEAQKLFTLIHVDDDGEGIDVKDAEKIFKAFTRLEKSRNKTKGGFGLGLAIVQRIMQWHQGNCIVSRSPLGGARFTLSIPIKKGY